MQNYLIILNAIIKGYNKYVIIALISMGGGEIMRRVIDFILDVAVQVLGNYLYKWLSDKINDDN